MLAHKLREAFNAEIVGQTLDDEVEIDGSCYEARLAQTTTQSIALTVWECSRHQVHRGVRSR